jgi:hypothetical protein
MSILLAAHQHEGSCHAKKDQMDSMHSHLLVAFGLYCDGGSWGGQIGV